MPVARDARVAADEGERGMDAPLPELGRAAGGELKLRPLRARGPHRRGHRFGGFAPESAVSLELLGDEAALGGDEARRERGFPGGGPIRGDACATAELLAHEILARRRLGPRARPDFEAGRQLFINEAIALDRVGEDPGAPGGDERLGDPGLRREDDDVGAAGRDPGEPIDPSQADGVEAAERSSRRIASSLPAISSFNGHLHLLQLRGFFLGERVVGEYARAQLRAGEEFRRSGVR